MGIVAELYSKDHNESRRQGWNVICFVMLLEKQCQQDASTNNLVAKAVFPVCPMIIFQSGLYKMLCILYIITCQFRQRTFF